MMTIDEFFNGQDKSRQLFDVLLNLFNQLGPAEMRITKSQIALRRQKAFAWVWMPGKYLHGRVALLVLTLAFRTKDPSPRWKEIVEPSPGHFTHHLELYSIHDIDDQVRAWLQDAWVDAA